MQYLDPKDMASAYQDSVTTARKSWLKYDEIERLAANEIRTDLPSNMPKVNDGSLAATIRKVPKRIMAQPMTGKIKATDRDENWVASLVNIILEQRIIPNATTDAPFLNKWQTALRNALTYGSQPIYTFFTQHGTYTGADMSVPYVRNVYLEPGAVSDMASDYIFMDSYYTKLRLKRLIDKAREDGDNSMWDADVLQAIYDAGPGGKESQNMTQNERQGINKNEKGLYKLITCFNRGYEAPFYTFSQTMPDKIAGTQVNTNPTGDLPIIYLYADEDLMNPYGTGLVHVAGATQNVLDNLTQTDVLSTQIGAQPPINVHGDRTQTQLKSLVYAPSQFWFTGNAEVTPVVHTNPQFYTALPARMSLYKSQLQYQTGTFDNSVSSEAGNPGFSKTPQGVKALGNITDADDNFIQQRLGEAYGRVVKSMVNIHMNNMEGTELLKLEGDQIEMLATTDLVPTDENGEALTSEIEVVWDNVRGSFDFEVDPLSSMKSNDQDEAQNLQTALQTITMPVSYYMGQDGWKFNMGEAYRSLLTKMGLENIDKVLTRMTPEEKKAAQEAPFPIIDPPQIRLNSADIPPEYMPGTLQNAGIQASPAPANPSYGAQASLMTAKADAAATQAKTLVDAQTALQPQASGQPDQSAGQPSDQVDSSQQATAEMSAPQPDAADMQSAQGDDDEQTEQPPQTNLEQRIMDIQQQYECDPDTALTIMSAQDHGVTDEQLPQLLQLLAEEGAHQ